MAQVKLCVHCRWLGVGTNIRGGFRYFCALKREDLGNSILWRKGCEESEPAFRIDSKA